MGDNSFDRILGEKKQYIREHIPPATLTDEMIEQIRGVVREELQSAKNQTVWTPENEDVFLRGVLRSRLSLGVMNFFEYRAELARLDKQKAKSDVSLLVIKSSLSSGMEVELEYEGKRYQGPLYHVGDREQCDPSVNDTHLVSGVIADAHGLTDLGKSIVKGVKRSLACDIHLKSGSMDF